MLLLLTILLTYMLAFVPYPLPYYLRISYPFAPLLFQAAPKTGEKRSAEESDSDDDSSDEVRSYCRNFVSLIPSQY